MFIYAKKKDLSKLEREAELAMKVKYKGIMGVFQKQNILKCLGTYQI